MPIIADHPHLATALAFAIGLSLGAGLGVLATALAVIGKADADDSPPEPLSDFTAGPDLRS